METLRKTKLDWGDAKTVKERIAKVRAEAADRGEKMSWAEAKTQYNRLAADGRACLQGARAMTTATKKRDRMFSLRRPCERCPFRTDLAGGPYLTAGRAAEIRRNMLGNDMDFYCHEGIDYDALDDDWYEGDQQTFRPTAANPVCAGAMIVLLRQGSPSQMMRVQMALTKVDLADQLDMDAPVYESLDAFVAGHGGGADEDRECCAIANADCEAPAGYLGAGGIIEGDGHCSTYCVDCGEACCPSCSVGIDEILCPYCDERSP